METMYAEREMQVIRESFQKGQSLLHKKMVDWDIIKHNAWNALAYSCTGPYIINGPYLPRDISLHREHVRRFQENNMEDYQMCYSGEPSDFPFYRNHKIQTLLDIDVHDDR